MRELAGSGAFIGAVRRRTGEIPGWISSKRWWSDGVARPDHGDLVWTRVWEQWGRDVEARMRIARVDWDQAWSLPRPPRLLGTDAVAVPVVLDDGGSIELAVPRELLPWLRQRLEPDHQPSS